MSRADGFRGLHDRYPDLPFWLRPAPPMSGRERMREYSGASGLTSHDSRLVGAFDIGQGVEVPRRL